MENEKDSFQNEVLCKLMEGVRGQQSSSGGAGGGGRAAAGTLTQCAQPLLRRLIVKAEEGLRP